MRFIHFAGILLLSVAPVFAQSQLGTGAISGVVQDSSGALVSDAKITVTNLETGLTRQIASGSGGQFSAPVLPVGSYKLRFTKAGFAALEENGIIVDVRGTSTLTATMKVGGVTETVTVEGAGAIDVTQTDVSSLVDSTEIRELPINGRRYYDFALLA